MQVDDTQLSMFLLESGILSRHDVESIEAYRASTGESFQKAAVHAGLVSEGELRHALGKYLGIPFVKLQPHEITLDVLTLIPEPFARTYHVIAFANTDDSIEIASLEPILPPLPFLPQSRRVLLRLTDNESMKRVLLYYQRHIKKTVGDSIARHVQSIPAGPIDAIAQAVDRFSVIEIVDLLLQDALLSRASDIHLTLGADTCTVKYRIQGILCDALILPLHVGVHIIARFKQLAHLSPISILPQQGHTTVAGAVNARLIVSSSKIATGERMVLHLIPEALSRDGFTLETLGFHGQSLERVELALHTRSGLILVTGAPGTVKTTTLYTLLDLLASPEKTIVTAEYERSATLSSVTQLEHSPDISMANLVRAALHQDPDVLMIDSITDEGVASLAYTAANRGHLVVASIEGYSAAEGITNLQSLIPTLPIENVVTIVIAVSQVRKVCDERDMYHPVRAEMALIEAMADPVRILQALKKEGVVEKTVSWKELLFPRAIPCNTCDAGYRARIGLQEVLPVSRTLKALLKEGADAEAIERAAWEEGMQTLAEDGIYKTAVGITTLEEVIRVARGE